MKEIVLKSSELLRLITEGTVRTSAGRVELGAYDEDDADAITKAAEALDDRATDLRNEEDETDDEDLDDLDDTEDSEELDDSDEED